jgi:Flp pilus assembly protein TadD/TolB-like protein
MLTRIRNFSFLDPLHSTSQAWHARSNVVNRGIPKNAILIIASQFTSLYLFRTKVSCHISSRKLQVYTLQILYPFTSLPWHHGIHELSGGAKLHNVAAIMCFALFLRVVVASAADPSKIIVFPLNESTSDANLEWLSEGIAVSISKQLGSHHVKVIDREKRVTVTENLNLPVGAQLSRASMIRIAQQAPADLAVMGTCEGTQAKLRISVRVLDMHALKLSGKMSANGPLSALPQMENELAWLILTNTGIEKSLPREKYQERIRKIPNAAYACYIQSFGASGESEKIRLLQKAVEAYRDFPEAQFRLGSLYFHQGECRSALFHLELGDGGFATHLESEFMKGTCYMQSDRLEEAIQIFSQLLKVSRSFEILNNLGVTYLRAGENIPALNVLTEAKALAHADSTISLNLAVTHYLQGNGSVARSVLQDATNSDPNNGMLQFVLGFFLKNQGENEQAAEALSRARSLGINVEKLLKEDPKTWSGVFLNWSPQIRD